MLAGTRKVKPIWISLKQETVSGSGISWALCKSAHHCKQITTPAPHHSVFLQAGCPSCCPTNSVKALKAPIQQYKKYYESLSRWKVSLMVTGVLPMNQKATVGIKKAVSRTVRLLATIKVAGLTPGRSAFKQQP